MELYRCSHCGNIISSVNKTPAEISCCGAKMEKLSENTVEASTEKHLPVIHREKGKVTVVVGSVSHPMEEKHYITNIWLETSEGIQVKNLKAGDKPEVEFYVAETTHIIKAYAYCNLHGLWSTSI